MSKTKQSLHSRLIITASIIVLLVAAGSYVISFYQQRVTREQKINYESDIPKLYPGIQWKYSWEDEFGFESITGKPHYAEGYGFTSEDLDTFPEDFIQYYKNELKARSWKLIHKGEGPGAVYYNYSKIENYNFLKLLRYYWSGASLHERFFSVEVKFPDDQVHKGYYSVVKYSIE